MIDLLMAPARLIARAARALLAPPPIAVVVDGLGPWAGWDE